MEGLRLHLLGRFTCGRAGRAIELPLSTQRLTAFLGLRGPSHRSLIAGSLWPEVPEPQALASLRTGVWRMNRLAPGVLEIVGDGLCLSPTTSVDSAAQERVVDEVLGSHMVDGSTLRVLCQPELLSGWYDDWVMWERVRLSQLRLRALEVAARLFVESGQFDVALRLALEAVRAEPLRETAHGVLMSVYLAEGNVSDAIHQYRVFRDLLFRELGLEPSPRLTQLLPQARGVDSIVTVSGG
ncbi:AfsR/SARP family transcriptional regulator [Kribbella sp. NBC_00359]|uniref:AfsR/SARP family transcriptional regulator n=1 Tax=Kribbella sp. NBC_00359 TaxID=2975966 RepID=UPI002E1BB37E